MKKFLLVVLMLIFLSGCSVDYTVEFNDLANETVKINGIEFSVLPTPAFIYDQGASETNDIIEGIEYYDISKGSNPKTFKYSFNLNDYDDSTAANTCLNSVKLQRFGKKTLLNTSSNFSCFEVYELLDTININLVFDNNLYNVLDSNADVVNGNNLKWTITKDNYKDKYIQVSFENVEKKDNSSNITGDSKNDYDEDIDNEVTDSKEDIITVTDENRGFIIIICIIIFIGGMLGVIIYKVYKSNRF